MHRGASKKDFKYKKPEPKPEPKQAKTIVVKEDKPKSTDIHWIKPTPEVKRQNPKDGI